MKNTLLFCFLILANCVSNTLIGQTDTTKKEGLVKKLLHNKSDATPVKNKLYIIVVPALAANPSAGFIYGVASTAGIYLGDPNTTQVSSGVSALTYTTKNQLVFTVKTNIYLENNAWVLNGDLRIFKTSQPTYGLGTGPQSAHISSTGIIIDDNLFSKPIDTEQMLHFNWIRFHETLYKQVHPRLFLGIGYHLDIYSKIDDKLLNLDTTNGELPTLTSHWTYSQIQGFNTKKYSTSGISLNVLWDNRDNAITPYTGNYALVTYKTLPKFLGSSKLSTQLWMEYRDYFSLSDKEPSHLLSFWTYGQFSIAGKTPYLALPAIGMDFFGRSGRAYTQGRFRGEHLSYTEVEYRFPLKVLKNDPSRFAGVAFVNGTSANSEINNIDLYDYIEPGYGIGIRILINKKTRAHLAVDYAWGNYGAHGFYFNINEAF